MKWIRRILFLLFGFSAAFIICGVIVSTFFQKPLREYIVQEINKSLKTSVEVTISDLSIWNTFPYASLELNTIVIHEIIESKETSDTLIWIKRAYLKFNILDIIQNNYKIKEIEIEKGFASIHIDKRGLKNYVFWQETNDTITHDYILKLDKIEIADFHLYYLNEQQNHDYDIKIEKGTLNGLFSDEKFALDIISQSEIKSLVYNKTNYIKNRKLETDLSIEINKKNDFFSVNVGKLVFDDELKFELSGTLSQTKEKTTTDLNIKGTELKVTEIIDLLPDSVKHTFANYSRSGTLDLNLNIKGNLSKKETPEIAASFNVRNGTVTLQGTDYLLDNITLSGVFSNGIEHSLVSSSVTLETLNGTFRKGSIQTSCVVSNFKNPFIVGEINAQVDFTELKAFLHLDTLDLIEGNGTLSATYSGYLNDFNSVSKQGLNAVTISGNSTISEGKLKLKNNSNIVENLTGKFSLTNSDIEIKQLKGTVGSSDFELNGNLKNVLSYIFLENEFLEIDANYNGINLSLDELLTSSATTTNSTYAFNVPKNIAASIYLTIQKVRFREFSGTDLLGTIRLNNGALNANNLSIKTMKGSILLDAILRPSENNTFALSIFSKIETIAISELFKQCEEFGQTVLTSRHLGGIASADISFVCKMDSTLTIESSSIQSLTDIVIEKGNLTGFEPFKDLTDQIRKKKLYSRFVDIEALEKKLGDIRFSTIKNQIEIKNREITLPFMEINSSALDVEISGHHSFDTKINYQLNFFLSDVLLKKEEKEESQHWEIRKDGKKKRKVFLNIVGTFDEFEIRQNKEEYKDQIKKEIKSEKVTVKSLLKEEFNLFSKDTTIKSLEKPQEKLNYTIEWEESTNPPSKPTDKTLDKADKPKKGLKGLLNLEKNEEETERFEPK